MLRYTDYNIVFQEIPDEVTLAINISGCPNRCTGCHSPWLWEDIGIQLTDEAFSELLSKYRNEVTCVCFMGGDADPAAVEHLALKVRELPAVRPLKTAWYSGRQEISPLVRATSFDFIKLGPYIAGLGSLKSMTTNQRLYAVSPTGEMTDLTPRFWKKGPL